MGTPKATTNKLSRGDKSKEEEKKNKEIKTATKNKQKVKVDDKQVQQEKKKKKKNDSNNDNKKKKGNTSKSKSNGAVKSEIKKQSNGNPNDSVKKRKRKDEELDEEEEEGDSKLLNVFPMNRVQRIAKSEGSDFKMSQEAYFLINKAMEKFIGQFCEDAYDLAPPSDRRGFFKYRHLSSVVCNEKRYDFLSDFVPEKIKVEDALKEIKPEEKM